MIRLEHIAIVVKNIDEYLKYSVFTDIKRIEYDPIQDSRIAIISTGEKQIDIELIEPKGKTATTYNFLVRTGGGLHHLCYRIDSEKELNEIIKDKDIKKILGPVNAVTLDNRKVVFGINRNREIVEFVFEG